MSASDVEQNTRASASTGSQLTAENREMEVDGDTLVYRRFGNDQTGAPPLVFLQHFRGNLDFWDPWLIDSVAASREVVLLANRGVGASTGIVPDNVTEMARDVLLAVDALGLEEIDLLGFSLGGFVAQELALRRPRLARRIVLAGTAPEGGPDLHRWSDDVYANACADEMTPNTADQVVLRVRPRGFETLNLRIQASNAPEAAVRRRRQSTPDDKHPGVRNSGI